MKVVYRNCIAIFSLLSLVYTPNSGQYNGINNPKLAVKDSNQEFNLPVVTEPNIPGNTVYITDFGGVNDGQTLNTKAIADAIDEVTKKGGGTVVIPMGIWLTGPIILKSNLNIHADEGALIIFSSDKDLYPLIENVFEGTNTVRCISPIYGKDLENISFTGKGIFDGTGQVWRPVKKEKLTETQWRELIRSGGVLSKDGKQWYPSESYLKGQNISEMNVPPPLRRLEDYNDIKDFLRPVMVNLVNCRKILFDGSVFQNSPAWCLHPIMCEDLTIRNVTIRNPWYSQNGDGLDLESCRNVIVQDCSFDVGDDAICIKSGKDADGRKIAKPSENIIIRNCVVYHGHGGVTIGSEMSGGVKNIYVSKCTFIGTDVGLRFKSNRGRGGVVEKIFFSDILMINIPIQAIAFNMYYAGMSPSELLAVSRNIDNGTETVPAVTEETPCFRNISIKNLTCKGASQAVLLQGLPELNLENIVLENIDIEADNGVTVIDAKGLTIKGMRLISKKMPAFFFLNSQNVDIERLNLQQGQSQKIEIMGKKTKNVTIRLIESGSEKRAVIGQEVDSATVRILKQ
jgi:polygalacturonase